MSSVEYLQWPNPKDPGADRIYTVTWEDLRSGEIIVQSDWIIPDGVTATLETFNNSVTQLKIAGGTDGETYDFVNTITTNQDANTIPRTIRLKVKNR